MKRIIIVFLALVLVVPLVAQEEAQNNSMWPTKYNSLNVYVSTLLVVHLVNVGFDHLTRNEKGYAGVSGGISSVFWPWDGSTYFGPYFTYTKVKGFGNHHLEARFGMAFTIFEYSEYEDQYGNKFHVGLRYFGIDFMPVLSLAYRFQKPGDNSYFRAGISPGGIGIGVGFVFPRG
ncbi:MAG: hypothetical protein IH594_18580 [Bacteroidales bacterium]|nr:hypothetical protein [Bacteroidales bacterium]